MPIGTHAKQITPFHLPADEQIPEKDRPMFFARFVTAMEAVHIEDLIGEAIEATGRESIEKMVEVLAIFLVGWKHVKDISGHPCEHDKVQPMLPQLKGLAEKALSVEDLWHLYRAGLSAIRTAETDLGKSESPSDSDTASSANTADQDAPASPAADV